MILFFYFILFIFRCILTMVQVNEDIRKKMFALRQTWNDVFPPAKLYTLDVKVKAIDLNWPITAQKISPAIHVNPNFFSTTVRS